jgi:hypothetical protein
MDTRRRRRGDVKTLVEDEELLGLRTMAEGSEPFEASGLWERLASLGLKEIMKLPPRERLGVGYYTAAHRHDNLLKEDAQRRICLWWLLSAAFVAFQACLFGLNYARSRRPYR